MLKRKKRFFYALYFILSTTSLMGQSFIHIKDGNLYKDQRPYQFVGINFWYGMNLGNAAEPALRARLVRELDILKELGITNLRIMAASEGPNDAPWRISPALQEKPAIYNEDLWKGLDFLLVELSKREMHAVLCLNNMWPWSGGFAQYVNWTTQKPIPYPPPADGGKWLSFMKYSATFFNNREAQELYLRHIKAVVQRINSISAIPYNEDPTIMAWQLANEPRPILNNWKYRRWIRKTAAYIKSLDSNHMVSIGSEGNAFLPLSNKFKKEHKIKAIDYITFHIWLQNWGWYDPEKGEKDFEKALIKAKKYIIQHAKIAKRLKKPLILEEFGLARDEGSYAKEATTRFRDRYFKEVFELLEKLSHQGYSIAGSNCWAWAGEGRPRSPKAIWKRGDDFIGDPPFEYQGWYSIYDTDVSTLNVLKAHAERIKNKGH